MTNNIFSGVKEEWLPLYMQLKDAVTGKIGSFLETEKQSSIVWKHISAFAEIKVNKKGLTVSFPADKLNEQWPTSKTVQLSKNRITHYFEIINPDIIPLLAAGIQNAYELTKGNKSPQRTPKSDYKTVDEYIETFSENNVVMSILQSIRQTILQAAPQATEKISWQMPTYHYKENLIHFAAAKNHVSIFPSPEAIIAFSSQLKDYKTSKGTIQFPFSKPIPYPLIAKITKWRVAQVIRKKGV